MPFSQRAKQHHALKMWASRVCLKGQPGFHEVGTLKGKCSGSKKFEEECVKEVHFL